MATHVHLLLQTKLYQLLSGDATITGFVGVRVYDFVPDNPTYPYLSVGDLEFRDWGSHTHDGFECDATIHTWTQAAGRKSATQVMNRIYQLLHNVDLAITGYPTVTCREADRRVIREADGKTFHGVQRYRIILGGN